MIGLDIYGGTLVGATGDRVLRRGDKGDDVRALQQALTSAGFDTKGADGDFGKNTEKALIAYQAAKGLGADGKAGPITFAALGLLAAPPVSQAAQTAVAAAGAGAPTAVTAAVAKEASSGDPAQARQAAAQAKASAATAAASNDPQQVKQAAAQVQAAAANAPPAVQQQAHAAAQAAATATTPAAAAAAQRLRMLLMLYKTPSAAGFLTARWLGQ